MYDTAAFYGDKLVAATNGAERDIYLLANAYFMSKQHRRCLHLLQSTDVIHKDPRFRYLAARCLMHCKEWEECLNILGGVTCEGLHALPFPLPSAGPGAIDHRSVLCLLRGQVYDALENFPQAIKWYTSALQVDPFNVEAFHALINGNKMTNSEEIGLVKELIPRIPPEHEWLALLYRASCKKYEDQATVAANIDRLLAPENGTMVDKINSSKMAAAGEGNINNQNDDGDDDAMVISPDKPVSGTATDIGNINTATTSTSNITTTSAEATHHAKGWFLGECADVIAAKADLLFQQGWPSECYALTSSALEQDPYALELLPVHLAAAVTLKKGSELFLLGHRLVDEHPGLAISWYAVGCYYTATQQHDTARRYFAKATTLDKTAAAAWVAFGHSFAAQDESDQAMAAYRTAARLFPGLQVPLVGIGMEYSRMNNMGLAEQIFKQALSLCSSDPLAANEIGVIALKYGQLPMAATYFCKALTVAGDPSFESTYNKYVAGGGEPEGHSDCHAGGSTDYLITSTIPSITTNSNNYSNGYWREKLHPRWEPTIVNLGHVFRKLGAYKLAVEVYERALGLCPGEAGTRAALGYAYHLGGEYDVAIEQYHAALSLKPDDAFVTEMLTLAMQDDAAKFETEVLERGEV
jgi:anaphase-promoting complex subunit 6